MLNIDLQPEYVLRIGSFLVSNTLLTSFLVTLFLAIVSAYFYYARRNSKNIILEIVRVLVFDLLKFTDAIVKKREVSKKVLPLIASFFIFIVSANILALFPGFLGSFYIKEGDVVRPLLRSPNSDLNTTLALALFSVLSIQFFSARLLGLAAYLSRFINFSSPLKFIMGFFETISEGVKVLSFSFRLFGNIFAGEVLLLIIAFLAPYIIPVPFMFLEVFVGIVQAFIFSALTLAFIRTSAARRL